MLWQSQRADGSWECYGNLGPWVTAQALITLRYVGELSDEDAREYSRWLRAQQSKDGSFRLHAHSEKGDLGSTAAAWAAFHAANVPENAEAIAAARAWVDRNGGIKEVVRGLDRGDPSALFVAMAGCLNAQTLPCPDTAALFLPPVSAFIHTRFHSGVTMMAFQLEAIVRRLRGEYSGPKSWLLTRQLKAALADFQNEDGSWNDAPSFTVTAVAALFASGMNKSEPMLRRALDWLASQKRKDSAGLRYDGFGSEVWSTAFNVRALLEAGTPPGDADISRAVGWLVDAQLHTPMPAVDNRQRGAQLAGGWAFQRTNHTMADCDDAGVVLSALGLALSHQGAGALDARLSERVRRSADFGVNWLFGMQNPDGGWSAFVWGLPGKPPGPIMTKAPEAKLDSPLALAKLLISPPEALGDPSTEDLTSRVLHGLGRLGYRAAHPKISKAIDFLRVQQCPDGSWWGRWVVNYLSATAFVLMGLKSVEADFSAPWIRRAIRWIESKQNPDGGFGEGPDSYKDPSKAGVGPSMPPLTGLVLQALIDAGEADSDTARRAADYLLDTQRADGTWPNNNYLHTNVPPDTFYVYEEAARFYPTEALARVLRAQKEHSPPPPIRWTDSLMDSMRGQKDPLADQVVAEVFRLHAAAGVNDVLSKLFRSDDPVPPGLPPLVADYFEATRPLPAWADKGKLAVGQGLFTRAGWGVAMGLFCSSLPQAYAAAKGAHVLTQTQGMTRHVRQRIFETAQFLFDVLDENAFGHNGRGIATAQKVRLMHAAIRHLLLNRPNQSWDAAALGMPVNQEDLAGTLMTFSVVTLDGLERIGMEYSQAEAESWLHTWNVIGHYLGIREDMMPRDLADADHLMETIRERQWAASADGRTLIKPLVEMMQEYFPGKALDGIPVAIIRYLAGDHCADLLGLPKADWTRHLFEAAHELEDALDDLVDPPDAAGRVVAIAAKTLMQGIVLAEREGKQAKFRIPPSLRRSVDPNQ